MAAKEVHIPLHSTLPPERLAKHLRHLSGLTPGHTHTITPYKEQARPLWGVSKQGNLFVLSLPCCRRPNKALPEFFFFFLASSQFLFIGEDQESWTVTQCQAFSVDGIQEISPEEEAFCNFLQGPGVSLVAVKTSCGACPATDLEHGPSMTLHLMNVSNLSLVL